MGKKKKIRALRAECDHLAGDNAALRACNYRLNNANEHAQATLRETAAERDRLRRTLDAERVARIATELARRAEQERDRWRDDYAQLVATQGTVTWDDLKSEVRKAKDTELRLTAEVERLRAALEVATRSREAVVAELAAAKAKTEPKAAVDGGMLLTTQRELLTAIDDVARALGAIGQDPLGRLAAIQALAIGWRREVARLERDHGTATAHAAKVGEWAANRIAGWSTVSDEGWKRIAPLDQAERRSVWARIVVTDEWSRQIHLRAGRNGDDYQVIVTPHDFYAFNALEAIVARLIDAPPWEREVDAPAEPLAWGDDDGNTATAAFGPMVLGVHRTASAWRWTVTVKSVVNEFHDLVIDNGRAVTIGEAKAAALVAARAWAAKFPR